MAGALAAPWAMPAMMAATEAGGAGMAAAAAAEAAAAALASGVATSAIPGIASTAAGSAIPGAALPAMQAAGTQGLAGTMGSGGLPGIEAMYAQMGGGPTAGSMFANSFGTQLPGSAGFKAMADTAMTTAPWLKQLAYQAQPITKALGNANKGWQLGQKLLGPQPAQAQAQRPMAPAAPPPIQPMSGNFQKLPSPAQLQAYQRYKNRKRMMEMAGEQGGMMT